MAREDDLGVNDDQIICKTHLGHLLKVGDIVMGYYIMRAVWATEADANMKCRGDIPDVILVRKYYANKSNRMFELKELDVEETMEKSTNQHDERLREKDYENFLQEIEGDKDMRKNMNLY